MQVCDHPITAVSRIVVLFSPRFPLTGDSCVFDFFVLAFVTNAEPYL